MRYNWEGPAQIAAGVVPSIQAGFQAGAQQGALSRFGTDPQGAINALMPINPEMAVGLQDRRDRSQRIAAEDARRVAAEQQAAMQKQLEEHRERITIGAKLIEQIQPTDEAGWQKVRASLQQYGYDVSDIPPTFDPAYVDGVRQIGRAMAQPAKPTALEQNYDFLSGKDPALAQTYLRTQAEGRPVLFDVTGDGVPDLVPPSYFGQPGGARAPTGGPQPGTIEDGYRFKGGNPADPANWEEVGGPGPSGPDTFP